MEKHNQNGSASSIIIIIILAVLLIGSIIFGSWSYSGRQKYKNNTTSLINIAVDKEQAAESTIKDAQFAKQEQYPFNTYVGPEADGSITVKYPKTWSGYADSSGNSGNPLVTYFNPGVIPSVTTDTSNFALSVQVVDQTYSTTLQSYQGQTGITVNAYSLPKLPKIIGVVVSGPISQNQTQETMVILPLRGDTLEISTDGSTYLSAFNSIILPNLSFSP